LSRKGTSNKKVQLRQVIWRKYEHKSRPVIIQNSGKRSTSLLLSIPERKGDYILYNSMRD